MQRFAQGKLRLYLSEPIFQNGWGHSNIDRWERKGGDLPKTTTLQTGDQDLDILVFSETSDNLRAIL
jgi:hypothetical protein